MSGPVKTGPRIKRKRRKKREGIRHFEGTIADMPVEETGRNPRTPRTKPKFERIK